MKTMTEKEFDKWCADLAEVLDSSICVERDEHMRNVYLGGNIITTVTIKQERQPLPVDTLIYDADSNQKWYASGNCNTVYQACYFGATTSETAKEHGIFSRYSARHDNITVVSYPGEEAEAWKRVAELERSMGTRTAPSVEVVFMAKLAEVRAENDRKYGYPRAEVEK